MSTHIDKAKRTFEYLKQRSNLEDLYQNLRPYQDIPSSYIPYDNTPESTDIRIEEIRSRTGASLQDISKNNNCKDTDILDGSIENFIGFTQIPTGVVGPIKINGSEAKGDFFVPLATTEGALVASYHRGAKATNLSGGITSVCVNEGVRRSPLFAFKNIEESLRFSMWLTEQKATLKEIAESTTNHGRLNEIYINMEGNHVIITLEYFTGDAAGQNMVTICSDAICQYIINSSPINPRHWYVESNYSGDKKASAVSFTSVRGKKVTAECTIPSNVLRDVLKTTAASVEHYWRASTVSVIQSGSIGAQGHLANGLAALFLATGQDVACVSEASVGVTRMSVVNNHDLYIAVTMPNIIVGTVGGGTKFSTQQECLNMMQCNGTGMSRKFSEICGALLLCGELSIASALSEGHFTSAHEKLGRKKS